MYSESDSDGWSTLSRELYTIKSVGSAAESEDQGDVGATTSSRMLRKPSSGDSSLGPLPAPPYRKHPLFGDSDSVTEDSSDFDTSQSSWSGSSATSITAESKQNTIPSVAYSDDSRLKRYSEEDLTEYCDDEEPSLSSILDSDSEDDYVYEEGEGDEQNGSADRYATIDSGSYSPTTATSYDVTATSYDASAEITPVRRASQHDTVADDDPQATGKQSEEVEKDSNKEEKDNKEDEEKDSFFSETAAFYLSLGLLGGDMRKLKKGEKGVEVIAPELPSQFLNYRSQDDDSSVQPRPYTKSSSADPEATPLTLQNVKYVSRMEESSSVTSLSTMGDPITKDIAKEVYHRRVVPHECPLSAQEEVSTICGETSVLGKNSVTDIESKGCTVARPPHRDAPSKSASASVATAVSTISIFLHRRSPLEIFFIGLAVTAAITLLILMIVVFAGR